MARNGSGTYNLPATVNPVVSGTTITAAWANTTLPDIGAEITNSLPRDGQAPMTAALKLVDGSVAVPGISFNSEPSTGIYRPGTSQLSITTNGVTALTANAGNISIPNSLTVSGTMTGSLTGSASLNVLKAGDTMTGTLNLPSNGLVVGTSQLVVSGGNVGVGATPDSWGTPFGTGIIQGQNGTYFASKSTASDLHVGTNAYYNGSTWVYKTSDLASDYRQASGLHIWSTAPTGTAGTALTFTEKMRLDSSGNLGIGGTPSAKLHVTASTDNSALVETTGTASAAFLQLKSGSGTTSARYSYVSYLSNETTPQEWRAGMYSNVNFVIRDHTAASNRLVIDTNGNVGVGIAAPTNYANYVVIEAKGKSTTNGGVFKTTSFDGTISGEYNADANGVVLGTVTNHAVRLNTNSVERLRIDASGNFLVGTTTANYGAANRGLIEVNGSTDSLVALKRGNAAKAYLQAVSDDGLLLANVTSTGYMAFNTNSAERLRIDANGNLGVNVTPQTWHASARAVQMGSGGALWNYSSTQMNLSQGLYYDSVGFKYLNTGVASSTLSMNSGALFFQQAVSGTAGTAPTLTTPFQIDASGNVGVGVTPTVKLDVNGSMRLGSAAVLSNSSSYLAIQSAGELVLDSASVGGDISFRINSSEMMRLDSSGNLGVGTASPGAKFAVSDGSTTMLKIAPSGGATTISARNNTDTGANILYYSGSLHTFKLNTTNAVQIDSSGNLLNVYSGGTIGYGTGSGGAVTQATSKSTNVTLNKGAGQITLNAAALAASTTVRFTLLNSVVAATDLVAIHLGSGGTPSSYQVWCDGITGGQAAICVRNISGGSLSEALVLNFAVIKAVAA